MVEGLQIIGRVLESGSTPLEAFVCRPQFQGETAPRLLGALERAGARITEVAPNVMARLSDREDPQGIVLAVATLEHDLEALTKDAPRPSLILVLDRLQDAGNLGTLIRTADAVGAAGVVLIEPCVDRFDPKTVSATMGSLFSLPVVVVSDAEVLFPRLSLWSVVGADTGKGDLAWRGEALNGSVALVLGNEARGVSPDVEPYVSDWVRLPLIGQAESLNVAIAGGALSYEWLKRNAADGALEL